MTDAAAVARQWACEQVLLKLFLLLDEKRYDDVAALFDADGVWERPTSTCNGRDDILSALRTRPAQRITRHVVTNVLIVEDDGLTVGASCLLTTYAAEEALNGTLPPLVDSVAGLYRSHAIFRSDGDEPTFTSLKMMPAWSSARDR